MIGVDVIGTSPMGVPASVAGGGTSGTTHSRQSNIVVAVSTQSVSRIAGLWWAGSDIVVGVEIYGTTSMSSTISTVVAVDVKSPTTVPMLLVERAIPVFTVVDTSVYFTLEARP